MLELREQNIFPQRYFVGNISPSPNVLQEIYKLTNSETRIVSNRGGWQSDYYTDLDWMEPVTNTVHNAGNEIAKLYGLDNKLKNIGYWINVNRNGNYNVSHNHPGCFLSAVWYVTAPKNCGSLIFESPDESATTWGKFIDLGMGVTDVNYNTWEEVPEVGKLIIFPAWMKHRVETNQSNEDRVSIAFNLLG
jgi:uncharacterized protein (TIGR02466 family)